MVSLVDLTTTAFQANLVLAVIFGAGYIFGKNTSALVLDRLARKVLLPSLVFTSLASSTFLTWHRLLQIAWPAVVVALITHLPSLLYAYVATKYFSAPSWTVPALTFNNTFSFPFLMIIILGQLSNDDSALGLLKWRVFDRISGVVDRAAVYIIINWALTEVARAFLAPVVDRLSPRLEEPEDDFDAPTPVHPVDEEDATETTPLVVRRKASPRLKQLASRSTFTSPGVIAFVLGLLIALIKPVQRKIIGVTPDQTQGSWLWQCVGLALYILGSVYAVLDIVRFGVETREIESSAVVPNGSNAATAGSNGDHAAQEEIAVKAPASAPPTLGTVLTLSFWRYVIIPLYTIPFIHLLRQTPSTKAYLQDPVFSLVLVLVVLAPPTSLPASHAFPAQALFSHYLTSLILALPISIAFAQYGRGVSYDLDFDLVGALKSAGGGGLAGALAMIIQVLTLMPLRTIMNYQYRYGGTLKSAGKTLYADGGFRRYYAGLAAALFQGPFARFGDTAANAFILALLATLTWPVLVKTIAASVASACFRMVLTPIDTLKTTQQTNGAAGGLRLLRERVRERGVACLWYGALATAAATFVGHYPWFATYNYLSAALPPPHNLVQKLLRQAFIGFAASVVSDTVSNSLRVVKTYRQVHEGDVGYVKAAKEIVASEGLLGLFGRGLGTRLLTNGLQGLLFSILWKFFADLIAGKA